MNDQIVLASHNTLQSEQAEGNNKISSVDHTDGLMQERRNSIANALELRLSCINPLMLAVVFVVTCTY